MTGRSLRAPRPGTALKRTGAALIAAAIIFYILSNGIVASDLFPSVPFDILNYEKLALQYFLLFVVIPVGAFLLRRGRQYAAQAIAKTIITDSKSHVLYLRAFRSDTSTLKQVFSINYTTLLWAIKSEEEQLAEVLLPFGELIAIGRPGEGLPTPGAARIYTSDEEWKDVVKRQIQASQLVVIRAGAGENVFWELTQAVKFLNPQKLLILLLNMKVKDYESFRTKANFILDVPLPESTRRLLRPPIFSFVVAPRWRVSGFIGFDADWKPRFFALRAPFFRGGSFKLLCKYALKPVFETSGLEWQAPPMSEKLLRILYYMGIFLGPFILLALFIRFYGSTP
jgi:hypothetical protein